MPLAASPYDPQRLDGCEGVGVLTGIAGQNVPLCLEGAPSEPRGMSVMANKVTEAVAMVGMTWWWIGGA